MERGDGVEEGVVRRKRRRRKEGGRECIVLGGGEVEREVISALWLSYLPVNPL